MFSRTRDTATEVSIQVASIGTREQARHGTPAAEPADRPSIGVVIPCYRVGASIVDVISRIGPEAHAIYVVDDACPDSTGDIVERQVHDVRVIVLRNDANGGVGTAVIRGYRAALERGATIVVKLDGDGQMDPALIPRLVAPIIARRADYVKGNRFAAFARMHQQARRAMPRLRWIGNNVLSFAHRAMTGYWDVADPTNGFTAIHRRALNGIDLDAVSPRFFFETDMLFQLNLIGAVVADVPMPTVYGDENSSLRVRDVVREFPPRMLHRLASRIIHKYFLYDFNVASVELLAGLAFFTFGAAFGAMRWIGGIEADRANTAGTVMLAALPVMLGFQLLLAAVSYDVANVPRKPLLSDDDA